MDGVELEFQANPRGGLHFDGSVGYLGFQYQDLGRADPDFILNNSSAAAHAGSAPAKCPSRSVQGLPPDPSA